MNIDLHLHTIASDGTLSPSELVRQAADVSLDVIAITDHDTTDGIDEALAAAGTHSGLRVIPGVELSATAPAGGDLHLLGYCIDASTPSLQRFLSMFRKARIERIRKIVDRLRTHQIPVEFEQVKRNAAGGAVSRAHVARVLIEIGVVNTIDEAFRTWLGRNRPGFVPRETLDARKAIELVLEARGVPVLAHPLTMGDFRQQLPWLIEAGLVGLEAHYGPYGEEERAMLAETARRYELIATGGSDYHGPDNREGRGLGSVSVPDCVLDQLSKHAPGCI